MAQSYGRSSGTFRKLDSVFELLESATASASIWVCNHITGEAPKACESCWPGHLIACPSADLDASRNLGHKIALTFTQSTSRLLIEVRGRQDTLGRQTNLPWHRLSRKIERAPSSITAAPWTFTWASLCTSARCKAPAPTENSDRQGSAVHTSKDPSRSQSGNLGKSRGPSIKPAGRC